MAQDRESQVRARAHAIWLEEGMPEGQAEEHWSRAETEFATDETSAKITPASAADAAPAGMATDDAAQTDAVPAAGTAPAFDVAPDFQNAEPAPEPPVVAAIVEPVHAPAARKPTRRKTKP